MAVTAAAVIAGLIGAGLSIAGASKKAKANSMAQGNPRPFYEIPSEQKDNLLLSTYMAQQGLPGASKQLYQDNASAGLTSTIDAILKGGGDPNSIGKSMDYYDQNLSKMAVADASVRLGNIQNLVTQRNAMSDARDKAWQINKYAPYADKAKAIADMASDGDKQMWQGIGQIGGAVASGATGIAQANSIRNLNRPGTPTPTAPGMNVNAPGSGGVLGGAVASGVTAPGAGFDSFNPATGQHYNKVNWDALTPESKGVLAQLLQTPLAF